ncbi:MAG: DNA polymerase I, partial [Clostridia bacterium]|nr:DNA polymerase I [Clostridia bacterium]
FFVPSDGEHILVGADYSQIELRLLAHFSECEKLVEAYKNDEDIHSLTASEVFGVPIGSVTKEMRRSAKAVNFGIIYGISEYGLAKNIKISPREAKKYIDRYFASYPNVKEYMEKNVEFARINGYVSTLCGRKRFIRDINSPNYNLRSFSERAAMNMPLQGSSADIIKIAMINVSNRLKRENLKSRLILQVHDELIIDALKTEKEQVEKLLKEDMEHAVKLRVPLTVEVYSGASLNEAK